MLKIKCPMCGSVEISSSNPDVVVHENIFVDEVVDYMIEGGNEVRVTDYVIRATDDPPYIETLESDKLEFSCDRCGYFFNGIHTDDEMLQYAQEHCLIVNCIE